MRTLSHRRARNPVGATESSGQAPRRRPPSLDVRNARPTGAAERNPVEVGIRVTGGANQQQTGSGGLGPPTGDRAVADAAVTLYVGPERRWRDRPPVSSARMIGRARLRSQWKLGHQGWMPGRWYTVIDRPGAAQLLPPLPGSFWIDFDGRPRLAWAEHFELELTAPPERRRGRR
jgi:hypothetical protein